MFNMTPSHRVSGMIILQKQVAYKYKGHPIYKYRVNIPTEIVEQIRWTDGQKLHVRVKGHDVVLCPDKEHSVGE